MNEEAWEPRAPGLRRLSVLGHMMKIKPLSQGDKESVAALARSLSMRALLSGEQADAGEQRRGTEVADQIRDFDRRLETIAREVAAHSTRVDHAVEIMQRRVAGLAGDFQAMRSILVEMESRIEAHKEELGSSVTILVQALTAELTRELDRLSRVAEDTALVQQEMVRLARQVTETN